MRPLDEMTPDAWHEAYSELAKAGTSDATGAVSWAYDCPVRAHVARKIRICDAMIRVACRKAVI
ncbi:MAG: hypothetical protein ING29_11305 [Azospirillum sp.]|nr:hypothetical protein [Azospirillum sp.]